MYFLATRKTGVTGAVKIFIQKVLYINNMNAVRKKGGKITTPGEIKTFNAKFIYILGVQARYIVCEKLGFGILRRA
jgi:hypothetical protein